MVIGKLAHLQLSKFTYSLLKFIWVFLGSLWGPHCNNVFFTDATMVTAENYGFISYFITYKTVTALSCSEFYTLLWNNPTTLQDKSYIYSVF